MCRLLCLILVVLPIYVEGGNILMYLPIASRSYVSAWTPLVQGLASAGHQVLFVTRFKIPPLPNLTQIEVKTDAMEELENTLTQKVSESFNMTGFIEAVSKTSSVLTKTHQLSLQELRYQLDKPWHLIITSPFLNEMGIILGHYLDIPNVQFLPTNAEMLMSYGLGHPDNGAWSSNLPDSTFGRFVYILLNAVYADFVKPHFFVYPQIDLARTMLVNFTLNKQDYWKLERNADFSFYMSSILMDNVNPRLPNTAQIGFIHCRDGKPLPQRIQNFYREAEDIVLYISFGSMIKAETLGNKTLHVFNKVLKGRKAIWKISKNIVENEDILTDLWFPQQDILAQSKTKVFISPCGLMSIQEAIYHNVPLLCIPMTREQITNSDVIQRKGLGIKLDISNLSVTSLEGAIDDLINNNYYKINLKKTSDLILDRPTPILEEAIFWVEHVLRHDGADHLKSRRRYMSMIEFYHLDVLLYLFIFLSISSIIGMGWWILVLISVKKAVKYFKQYTQLDTNNNKLPKKTFKLNEANIRENIDVKRTSDIDKKETVEMKDACDVVKGESSETQPTHNKTYNEEIEAHEDTSSSEAHEDTLSSEAGEVLSSSESSENLSCHF